MPAQNNPPRRHHTVPKTYLSGFRDRQNARKAKLCLYDRESREYRINQLLENVAVERDFYTVHAADGTPSYDLEYFLGSHIESVFPALIGKIEVGNQLTNEEQEKLVAFAVFQHFRSTRTVENLSHGNGELAKAMMMARYSDPEEVRMAMDAMKAAGRGEFGSMTPEELAEYVASGEYDAVSDREWTVVQAMKLAMDFLPMLQSMPRMLLEAPTGSSFITSDHPTALWAPPENCLMFGSVGFGTPGMECTLPLSSRFCLVITNDLDLPRPPAELLVFRMRDAKSVREINKRSVMNSDRLVIGPTEALVKSVVDSTGIASVARGPTSRVSNPYMRARSRVAKEATKGD